MSSLPVQAKKERERQLLEAFLKLSGISGELVGERESPDFVLLVDGQKVGVEITEIYVPDDGPGIPLKAMESLATKIVRDARIRYEAAKGTPLNVAVGFSPRADFKTLSRSNTANALADFLLGQSFPSEHVQFWRPTLNRPLPLAINFLNAFAVPNQATARWYASQAGWIVPLSEELLQASIDAKASKLHEYQRVAPEIWLVLVIAGGAPSQGFDVRHNIDGGAIRSPFGRTFLKNGVGPIEVADGLRLPCNKGPNSRLRAHFLVRK